MSQSVGGLGAVGLGALIGATLALAIDPTGTGLWIIGALVGGVVAYLAHEWRAVVRALVIVYGAHPTYSGFCACKTETRRVLGSRDFWRYWATYCAACGTVFSYLLIVFVPNPVAREDWLQLCFILGITTGATLFLTTMFAWADFHDRRNARLAETRAILLKFARYGNLIAVTVYWPIYGLIVGLARVPQVIRRINSDERILYFVCGSVGAAAGWLIGHGHFGEVALYGPVSVRAIAPLAGAFVGILLLAASRVYSRSVALPSDHS
ncbi:MAG: hypothetical protein Q7S95_01820 [bacterium]|nr:hypothetical protein [bacterium]